MSIQENRSLAYNSTKNIQEQLLERIKSQLLIPCFILDLLILATNSGWRPFVKYESPERIYYTFFKEKKELSITWVESPYSSGNITHIYEKDTLTGKSTWDASFTQVSSFYEGEKRTIMKREELIEKVLKLVSSYRPIMGFLRCHNELIS